MDDPPDDDADDSSVGLPRRRLLLLPRPARVTLAHHQSRIPAVALFATLLGIATVLHWDKFSHGHIAFWVWTALYFAAPFLVFGAWLTNRRYEAQADAGEQLLGNASRTVITVTGLLALITGATMFVTPSTIIPIWPWQLTPLTCRVVGAIFCLGCALVVVLPDPRWSTLRLMLQVELIMITLILVAAVRARSEFFIDRPLTWILLAGFLAMLAGSAYLTFAMRTAPSTYSLDAQESREEVDINPAPPFAPQVAASRVAVRCARRPPTCARSGPRLSAKGRRRHNDHDPVSLPEGQEHPMDLTSTHDPGTRRTVPERHTPLEPARVEQLLAARVGPVHRLDRRLRRAQQAGQPRPCRSG